MHFEEKADAPIKEVHEVAREPDNVDRNTELDETSHTEAENSDRFLKNIGLEQYTNVFSDNDMEMDVLLDLRPEEFMDMVKDLGIKSFAHRHKLKRAVEHLISNENDKKDAENVEVIAEKSSKAQDFLKGNVDDIEIGVTEADNSEYIENAYKDIPEENTENSVLVDYSGRVDD